MNIRIERGINSSFLVIEETGKDEEDKGDNAYGSSEFISNYYEYCILSENTISAFIPLRKRQENSVTEIIYDITSMISLRDLSEKSPLKYSEMCVLIDGIKNAQNAIEEYLLTPEGIILNPDYVFYDMFTKNIKFCFYPDYSKDVFQSYTELAEYLLLAIECDDEETVKLAYEIYASVLNKDYQFEKYVDKERLNTLSYENAKEKKQGNISEQTYVNPLNSNINEKEIIHNSTFDAKENSNKTSILSIGCIVALLIIGTIILTTFIVNSTIFFSFFNNKRNLTASVLITSILICIPFIKYMDNRRR